MPSNKVIVSTIPGRGTVDREKYVMQSSMATMRIRYIVDDLNAAIEFYCRYLGFYRVMVPSQHFALLGRDDFQLALSVPGAGGGGATMTDGTIQSPGGWNRFVIEVADLEGTVRVLRAAGLNFRTEIVVGVGGKQTILNDPSGNPIELFEPLLPEARLAANQETFDFSK